MILSCINGRFYFQQFLETFGTQALIKYENEFFFFEEKLFLFMIDFGMKFGNYVLVN